ncbi:MAG: RsmD family RNA methyltransferase [Geminicoccaceae bacterium]
MRGRNRRARAAPARAPDRGAGPIVRELVIERLGAAGDGIARLDDRPVYVAGTLPGERWRVRLDPDRRRGEPLERLEGPPRAEPVCPHFGRCGGCALQHLPPADYAAFKRDRVLEPLARVGLAPAELLATATSPPGSRRRLRLAFEAGRRGALRLGFRARASHAIEPIERCPVARPELERLLRPLAEQLSGLGLVRRAGQGEVLATVFPAGVDLLLLVEAEPDLADRERLAELARTLDLARLAIGRPDGPAEPLLVRRPPRLRFGPVEVAVPPGAFLQPTEEGEQALRAAVARWLPEGARLADLYAGTGALSLPQLDRLARLELVEGEPAMVEAVSRALAGRPRARTVRRDLARDPLVAAELAAFDVVLLDPPRAGARAQCGALAGASVPRVVYASCEPASFARDARVLVDGGFRLAALQPIDQFLWSAEVELVALFSREPARASAAARAVA